MVGRISGTAFEPRFGTQSIRPRAQSVAIPRFGQQEPSAPKRVTPRQIFQEMSEIVKDQSYALERVAIEVARYINNHPNFQAGPPEEAVRQEVVQPEIPSPAPFQLVVFKEIVNAGLLTTLPPSYETIQEELFELARPCVAAILKGEEPSDDILAPLIHRINQGVSIKPVNPSGANQTDVQTEPPYHPWDKQTAYTELREIADQWEAAYYQMQEEPGSYIYQLEKAVNAFYGCAGDEKDYDRLIDVFSQFAVKLQQGQHPVQLGQEMIESLREMIEDGTIEIKAHKGKGLPTESEIKQSASQTLVTFRNYLQTPSLMEGKKPSASAQPVKIQVTQQSVPVQVKVSKEVLPPPVLLLDGPTGCGKTLTAEATQRVVRRYIGQDIPLTLTTALNITESGYVGGDVTDLLKSVIVDAGGDLEKAERGMLFIDEIDKKARGGGSTDGRDVSGESVQNLLLPLLERKPIPIDLGHGRQIMFNPKNLLLMLGGAFSSKNSSPSLTEIVAERLKTGPAAERKIGFTANIGSSPTPAVKDTQNEDVLRFNATAEDLERYGFKREFVGRVLHVPYKGITRSGLYNILTQGNRSEEKLIQNTLEQEWGVNVQFTDGARQAIVDEALRRNEGARSLRKVLQEVTHFAQFNGPDSADGNYKITANTVKKALQPPKI